MNYETPGTPLPGTTVRSGILVSAIAIRAGDILLVRERAPGHAPRWVLPGGTAELGELAPAAIAREVCEETGLTVTQLDRLAFAAHYVIHDDARWNGVWTALTFEASVTGHLQVADPDQEILEAAWVPLPLALERLATEPFRPRHEPLLRHLRELVTGPPPFRWWTWPNGTRTDPQVISGSLAGADASSHAFFLRNPKAGAAYES